MIAGRLEHDLAGALQRLLAQHVRLAHQDTQPGGLRVDHDALTGETRAGASNPPRGEPTGSS